MAHQEITILNSIPQISIEQGRAGKTDRVVTFQAADGRAGFVRVPDESYSLELVRKAIGEELKKQGQDIGQKMKVDI
jgi:hypothetical protein